MKYFIGITPRGLISYISLGWGGRTTDRHITEESGFLNKIVPGDLVLADRGFDITDSVEMMCAEVKIPDFTKGKKQMSARSIKNTRGIASLRIHVEPVIGLVRNKYPFLSTTIPISMLILMKGGEMMPLDKVVHVCCALANLNPPTVRD